MKSRRPVVSVLSGRPAQLRRPDASASRRRRRARGATRPPVPSVRRRDVAVGPLWLAAATLALAATRHRCAARCESIERILARAARCLAQVDAAADGESRSAEDARRLARASKRRRLARSAPAPPSGAARLAALPPRDCRPLDRRDAAVSRGARAALGARRCGQPAAAARRSRRERASPATAAARSRRPRGLAPPGAAAPRPRRARRAPAVAAQPPARCRPTRGRAGARSADRQVTSPATAASPSKTSSRYLQRHAASDKPSRPRALTQDVRELWRLGLLRRHRGRPERQDDGVRPALPRARAAEHQGDRVRGQQRDRQRRPDRGAQRRGQGRHHPELRRRSAAASRRSATSTPRRATSSPRSSTRSSRRRTTRSTVKFKIREHEQVSVRRITFIGNDSIPDDELREVMFTGQTPASSTFGSGGPFRQDAFERDVLVHQRALLRPRLPRGAGRRRRA